MFASGYDIYDRISEPMQKFLETLTQTCASPVSPISKPTHQDH